MLPLIIKNREAAIVASNIFLSCFFSRKSIASSTFCMVRKVKLEVSRNWGCSFTASLILYLFVSRSFCFCYEYI